MQIYETLLPSSALFSGRPIYQLVKTGGKAAGDVIEYMQMPAMERPVLEFDVMKDTLLSPPDGFQYVPLGVPNLEWLVEVQRETRRQLASSIQG